MDKLSCDSPYAQSERECEGLKAWTPENFTPMERLGDPSLAEYTLIHHSICGFGSADPSTHQPWRTLLLQDPTRLAGNPRVSASLISESHRKVWAPGIGFLLAVQPENVVATRESDAGSPGLHGYSTETEKRLRAYSATPNWADIRPPREILKLSVGYNEIVLRGKGHKTGEPARVVGVILRCPNVKTPTRIPQLTEAHFNALELCSLTREDREALRKLHLELPFYCLGVESG